MRLLPLAALVLAPSLISADAKRNAAIVILPGAEDVKDVADKDRTTTTSVVRDPYPSEHTEMRIHEEMAALGWTRHLPSLSNEAAVRGARLIRLRAPAIGIDTLDFVYDSEHSAVHVWNDSDGNAVQYNLTRRCPHERDGLHSVYVTVKAQHWTAEALARLREMKGSALEELRKQLSVAERANDRFAASPRPKPTPCPWP